MFVLYLMKLVFYALWFTAPASMVVGEARWTALPISLTCHRECGGSRRSGVPLPGPKDVRVKGGDSDA